MFGLRALLAYFSRLSAGDAFASPHCPSTGQMRLNRPSGGGTRDAQAGKVCLLLISQVAGYYTISQHLSKFLTSPTALDYSRKLLTYFQLRLFRLRRIVQVRQLWNFREVGGVTNFLSLFTLYLRINPPLWVIMKVSKKPGDFPFRYSD